MHRSSTSANCRMLCGSLTFARRRGSRHAPASTVFSGEREMGRKRSAGGAPQAAAGNQLLDRRALLAAGAGGVGLGAARAALAASELSVEPWMREPGAPFVGYGQPS